MGVQFNIKVSYFSEQLQTEGNHSFIERSCLFLVQECQQIPLLSLSLFIKIWKQLHTEAQVIKKGLHIRTCTKNWNIGRMRVREEEGTSCKEMSPNC